MNAVTTIFGLEKLQSLLMSAVKNFSKKTIQSKDILDMKGGCVGSSGGPEGVQRVQLNPL